MPEYAKIAIIFLGFMFLITFIVMIKSGRFFKAFLTSALSGIGSLFAINLLTSFTGVNLAVNWFSIAMCTGFGLSGSISLLIMNILDKI